MDDKALSKLIAQDVALQGGQAYYVGGYVRDKMLNKENKDIDIEVHNILPNKLKEICSKYGIVNEVGNSFGILKIEHSDLDIAMPRKEIKRGNLHNEFDVELDPFMELDVACKRRDLTINAMMENILTGEIIDPFNGVNDLKNKIIRHIDDISFVEDPLRVFRAAGFAARLNFKIDEYTKKLCKKIDVTELSSERIFEETNKVLLKAEKPSIYFENLYEMDHLKEFFPEILNLKGVMQEPKYHPEGDAWNHTMQVIDNAALLKNQVNKKLEFMYAALFHDIGKQTATFYNEEKLKWQSIGHEIDGIELSKKALNRITNKKKLIKYVQNMVKHHMKPYRILKDAKYKVTNRFIDELMYPMDLIFLSVADQKGKNNDNDIELKEYVKWWEDRINHYNEFLKNNSDVSGSDLLNLGYSPDKIFNEVLRKTHELYLAEISKENILKQIPEIYKQCKIKNDSKNN